MLLKAFNAAAKARQKIERRLGRWARLLPFLSMLYGLGSGILIKRDFAHSTTLLRYLITLAAVSIFLRWWMVARNRDAPKFARRFGLLKHLWERPQLVENFGSSATQYAVQYICMFCLPLLFFARAYTTMTIAALVAVTTLWDVWWEKLSAHFPYLALIRVVSAVLATSFAFAVLFPRHLEWFHAALAAVACSWALPWHLLVERRSPKLWDLAPVGGAIAAVLAQVLVGSWLRVPLLSVWLDHPGLGVGIDHRSLVEPWPKEASRALVDGALNRGDEVCCISPVVGPSGLAANVMHEWRVDGRTIDRIELPPVIGGLGTDGQGSYGLGAFRTFSCKRHLPPAGSFTKLECWVYLAPRLFVDKVEVEVH